MEKTAAHPPTPQPMSGNPNKAVDTGSSQKGQFVGLAVTMTWQLAVAILVPIIAGVELDKALDSSPTCAILGFLLAGLASVYVMWRITQTAGRLPVPKLSAEQKKAIKKSYEEDDD